MSSFRPNTRKPYTRPTRGQADGQWVHDKFRTGSGRKDAGLNGGSVATPSAAPGEKLKVTNLHYEVTPKDLNDIFGQIGTLVREPLLWYDDSGRSTGNALVTFETTAEAIRAKTQYDGILAKGQAMNIAFYNPPRPRRAASAPSSLLNRIEKPGLLDRLARDDTATEFGGKKTSGHGKGRIGPIRAKVSRPAKAKNVKKQPKSAADLDKELDAFMGDVEPASQPTASSSGAQDVDMI